MTVVQVVKQSLFALLGMLVSLFISVQNANAEDFRAQATSAQNGRAQDLELSAINSQWQTLLTAHLSQGEKNGLSVNLVDYAAIKQDQRLAQLKKMLEMYPRERLDTQAKKIAYYLNAYNILAVAKVCDHWPLFKLKSLGSFYKPVWTHPVGEVCGEPMTLRKLEHEILRKLGEPRIHFALNCASVSCPDLRHEPYVAERIDEQLEEQTQIFMAQHGKGVVISGNELHLSSIFKWFEDDFESEGGVLAFVTRYLPAPQNQQAAWEVTGYLDYDWSVNDHLSGSEISKIKRGSGGTWFN